MSKTFEALDKWWSTEPFGFDNPDTYAGIKMVIEEERQAMLDEVKNLSEYHGDPYDIIKALEKKYGTESEGK